jgi:hypothetical protein
MRSFRKKAQSKPSDVDECKRRTLNALERNFDNA